MTTQTISESLAQRLAELQTDATRAADEARLLRSHLTRLYSESAAVKQALQYLSAAIRADIKMGRLAPTQFSIGLTLADTALTSQ